MINKNRIYFTILTAAVGLYSPSSYSNTTDTISKKLKDLRYVFQLGVFSANQGKAQHIDIVDAIGDDFSLDHRNGYSALVGLGVFTEGHDFKSVNLSYGVNAFYFPNMQVNGNVTQESLYTNLSYQYSISYLPVYLAAKADLKHTFSDSANWTFDLGIGPSFNRTSGFSERSLDGGITIPDYIFAGQSNVRFSAMAGTGVKFKNFIGNSSLECGYKFFYFGQNSLKKVNTQVVNSLKTGTNYANAILCSVEI